MINEVVPITLPGGGLASIVLPAFAVGYAISPVVQDGEEMLRISAVMKTPSDPTFSSALKRAQREYGDKLDWIPTSAVRNGGGSFGADSPYWTAYLGQEKSGLVELRTAKGDPLARDAYRAFSDRSVSHGVGFSELAGIMKRMGDADEGVETGEVADLDP